jgi:hypothetical protein
MENPLHTCPACRKAIPPEQYPEIYRFSETERQIRGKNERCPHCGWVLWIPFAEDSLVIFTGADSGVYVGGSHAIESPVVVLGDAVRH